MERVFNAETRMLAGLDGAAYPPLTDSLKKETTLTCDAPVPVRRTPGHG